MEVEAEHADVDRHDLDTVGAGDQHAGVLVDRLHHPDRRIDPGQHLLRRCVDEDPGVHVPAGARHLPQHERRVVTARQLDRAKPPPTRAPQRHPVQPTRPPGVGPGLPRDEVPATLPTDQPVGLLLTSLIVAVVEPDLFMITDRRRHRRQQRGVDQWILDVRARVLRAADHGAADRVHLAAQPVRQHLLQLGQRSGAGLLDPGDPGGRAQTHRHRDRLLVVQQQRRQLGTDSQPVVAARTADRLDGIAELDATDRCRSAPCARSPPAAPPVHGRSSARGTAADRAGRADGPNSPTFPEPSSKYRNKTFLNPS